MPPRHTEEEQADFSRALELVADQGTLPQAELDALSLLEGGDLDRFREVFAGVRSCASSWTWSSATQSSTCAGPRRRTWRGSRCCASSRISTRRRRQTC